MNQIILYLGYIACTLTGLFMFKIESASLSVSFTKNGLALILPCFVLFGIIFYACSFILWLIILKSNNISYAFPLLNGLVVALSAIGGILLLKEKANVVQIAGIGCILAGIILVNIKG
jgi:multidrug transporter EmrE-like cation transporter